MQSKMELCGVTNGLTFLTALLSFLGTHPCGHTPPSWAHSSLMDTPLPRALPCGHTPPSCPPLWAHPSLLDTPPPCGHTPLLLQGHMANRFAVLLQKLWSCRYSSVRPGALKKTLGVRWNHFSDNRQVSPILHLIDRLVLYYTL